MKLFQLKLFCNKRPLFKTSFLLIIVLFSLLNLNAQEGNSITFRIEPGFLLYSDSENIGLLFNVEPKIKSSENTVIGLRFGVAINSQKFKVFDSSQFFIDDQNDNAVISFVPTFDYYLNENNYRPYLGIGIGYYLWSYIDVSPRNGSVDVLEGSVNDQVGFLLRGGFELGKTRLGLEYNYILKADIEIPNGEIIGTVDNSYLGVSIGFTIGGGKNIQ